METRVI